MAEEGFPFWKIGMQMGMAEMAVQKQGHGLCEMLFFSALQFNGWIKKSMSKS